MNSEEFDLIVCGGGPGGSTVATLVAKAGFKVLLLERERFPRYQVGESLIPATAHGMADLLGIREELKQQGYPVKHGSCFRWGKSPEPWCFDFSSLPQLNAAESGYAYQVERSKFDHLLLNNARRNGVTVREEHAVMDYQVSNERVTGVQYADSAGKRGSASARFVVAATGNTSKLSSWVGERVTSKFFQNVALFTYYENGFRMPPPREGQFLAAAFKEGWFWYIPLNEKLTSVGAVVDKSYAGKLTDPAKAMEGFIDACPLIKKYLQNAVRVTEGEYGKFRTRKDYSYTTSSFWRGGALLVGDAACFVDPVFSTGVHLATYGGLLAARSINTVLRGGEIDEHTAFAEFEARYRLEYERIYTFLVSFYDMEQDQDSYYWSARRVNNTEERANDAFISLVSGLSSQEFFGEGQAKNSTALAEYFGTATHPNMLQASAHMNYADRVAKAMTAEAIGAPVRAEGLLPDGLFWQPRQRTLGKEHEAVHWAWVPGLNLTREST